MGNTMPLPPDILLGILSPPKQDYEMFRKSVKEGPNLKVNKSIVMFSSLTSTESLKQHYEKRRMEAGDCAADWIKSLAEKLAAFTSAPELAGLGALSVAVLIDIISSSSPEESVKEALRSVFAEEKASEVWNLIDECLKRYRMHINDKKELVRDIRRIEGQLSQALTNLKNSIVRDGHVSHQVLKVWVNGAAFHIQVLIHLVRLEETQNCDSIKSLIKDYSEDVDAVFEKHKEMIKEKFYTCRIQPKPQNYQMLVDDEGEKYVIVCGCSDRCFEVYYDEKYYKQKREIKKHFSDVEKNLPELIRQSGSLDLREGETDESEEMPK
ncbi:uncharacterized protein LOC121503687 [Cheilinus undulatus]|uniref:uncharacterized protein LOC121503687 n=1 Tax=Cheilinus undulatus TaxID=241271 RepID=UPI001BD27648|nr:uncharacterized protein LOC121503687 [Cheilinus undulatus]